MQQSPKAQGISVLVPVYCYAIEPLIQQLVTQLSQLAVAWEIRCYDDASTAFFKQKNQNIISYKNLIYKELPENVGRSRIRNLLAKEAAYQWLLFMDCDSLLPDQNYIARYADAMVSGAAQVYVGGTVYEKTLPSQAVSLRWYYGRAREQTTAAQRTAQPYERLTLNNMLISAQTYAQFPLDETLTTYGHEDTLFGFLLAQNAVAIRHLDNPVYHVGLEENQIFIQKTKTATRNLYRIYTQYGLGGQTRLFQAFLFLQKWHLVALFAAFYKISEPFIVKNLLSAAPSVRLLDLLKLHTLCQAAKT
ncbi:Glycosyltransferase, GT2 family [Flexibacter flexilis DSM 6793]|uniref:Glycosyltransferase, GT2 family n=1 Tax=Flexibacter flexilis DSM 6793 TaxID=927664 RepID=A0A1I1HRU2_9BACT|nr:glycosyltransferase [Flexibacter flexilis]SFC26272.1 Glycosyltransferase, GT2 family [Flexibacter flexilis DSM 6793]